MMSQGYKTSKDFIPLMKYNQNYKLIICKDSTLKT